MANTMTTSVSVEEVYGILTRSTEPADAAAQTPLREANGRLLCEDILSPFDVPRFNNSAMDGYAFRGSELKGERVTLALCGTSYAGTPFEGEVPVGACIRIMTGAAVPEGLDTVIPFEDVEATDAAVSFSADAVKPGANVRLLGEEIRRGQVVIPKGAMLTPEALGLAASFGRAALPCASLRVGVFSTGDELREPGEPLGPGQIYASNGYLLEALITRWGHEVVPLGVLPDDETVLEKAIRAAMAECDVLVTTGGVGEGDHDLISRVLGRLGSIEHFHVRMRPGKPLAFGYLDAGHPVFFMGLPGNPVAAAMSSRLFLRPTLARLSGLTDKVERPETVRVVCGKDVRAKASRTDFVRGNFVNGKFEGSPLQSSAMLTSLMKADAVLIVPEGTGTLPAGSEADAFLL